MSKETYPRSPIQITPGLVSLLSLCFLASCATMAKPQIEWTESKPPPSWLTQIKNDKTYFYYRGSHVRAESLEAGEKAARQNAYSQVAEYLKTDLESEYTGTVTDYEQDHKDVIKTRSEALIQKAEVVDSYYKTMTRIDPHSTLTRFDVFVLVRYPRLEADKELKRQQDEVRHKVDAAYDLYQKARVRQDTGDYRQARTFSREALTLLAQVKGALPLGKGGVSNSRELESLVWSQEQAATRNLRRVVVLVQEQNEGQPHSPSALAARLKATLTKEGFTVLDQALTGSAITFESAFLGDQSVLEVLHQKGGQFLIVGQANTMFSSTAMNKHFFQAVGTLRVFNTSSGDTVLTLPIENRGYHRDRTQAGIQALQEAGKVAGKVLVKELLAIEEQ